MAMKVRIKKTDKRLGIKSNEVYWAELFAHDMGKVVLMARVTDGYDPGCTQYHHEVEVISD